MASQPFRAGVSAGHIREVLDYDPGTGAFIWKHRPDCSNTRNTRFAGKAAGSIAIYSGKEYLTIRIDGVLYLAHRLAWVYVHGVWPTMTIDHQDGNGLNNRIDNLREATQQQQRLNSQFQTNSKSGFKGISPHGNKWRCRIQNGSTKMLRAFDDLEEAKAWYAEAQKLIHGEFAVSNRLADPPSTDTVW